MNGGCVQKLIHILTRSSSGRSNLCIHKASVGSRTPLTVSNISSSRLNSYLEINSMFLKHFTLVKLYANHFHHSANCLHRKKPSDLKLEQETIKIEQEANQSKRVRIVKETDIVRIMSEDGTLVGEQKFHLARQMAKEQGLYLQKIETIENMPSMPTFQLTTWEHIMKMREEQKELKSKKMKEPQEFRISQKIDPHDLEIKVNKMIAKLTNRRPVEVSVIPDRKKDDNIIEELKQIIFEKLEPYSKVNKSELKKSVMTFLPEEKNQNKKDDDS